jgi:hypothetical protein
MEVMHERNAHNFPLDLAAAESTTVALTAPAVGQTQRDRNYTDMLDSGSVQECAQACNADSTCVAFDRSTSGNCDAYQLDPAANFVGSGSGDWSCYTKVTLPDYCSSAYQDVVSSFYTFEA